MVIEKKTRMPRNKAYSFILQYDKMLFKIRGVGGPNAGESPLGRLVGAPSKGRGGPPERDSSLGSVVFGLDRLPRGFFETFHTNFLL